MLQAIRHLAGRKVFLLAFALTLLALPTSAQPDRKPFDPARFEADLEQFIVADAGLTPEESAKFFPLYRELRKKQLALMGSDRRRVHIDANDEKACKEAIRRHDSNEIEMKELVRTYHEKFMRVMPASKVLRVIRAEDKFHRQIFKRVAGHRR